MCAMIVCVTAGVVRLLCIARMQAVFRANDEAIDQTGIQEQSISTWCPVGAGLTNNEYLLDEHGTCLPPFSFSYARDFGLEIAHAQTVFVGAHGRGPGAPHRLDSMR